MIKNVMLGDNQVKSLYVGTTRMWRRIFSPEEYFWYNERGVWYDPSDLSTLFIDAAGTTPVTTAGDPVGLMLDKSGNGLHAKQTISANRPIYRIDENGKPYLESSAGGYMTIDYHFNFLVEKTGASLVMAFGKFVNDIACVIGNDSVRLKNRGFDIYLDDRRTAQPLSFNHTNPYDGATDSDAVANMISDINPYVLNYKQDATYNYWGTNIKPLQLFIGSTAYGQPNSHNMGILGAIGVDGAAFTTKTPDFYGMIIVDKAINDFSEINAYMLNKMGVAA